MPSVQEIVARIVAGMEEMGVTVVDASVYAGKSMGLSHQAVIVGFVPGRAAVFTVSYSHHDEETGCVKFTVAGQLTETGVAQSDYGRFPTLRRNPVGSEGYGPERAFFDINHYRDGGTNGGSIEERIASGLRFYAQFLEMSALLQGRFTAPVYFWFVPEYSEEYDQMKTASVLRPAAAFNHRVMQKFPVGYFHPEQQP